MQRQGSGAMGRLFSGGSQGPLAQQVEKATSHLLGGPDWSSNMEICDICMSNPAQTKEVIRALKKRLANKNSQVQLLTLTLMETMIKNCGEYVHGQVADSGILPDMVKMAKKKADMQVRERILELLDVWQEAFGGPEGRYREYWEAFDDLQRSGVSFPPRSGSDRSAPIFTPPQTQPSRAHMPVPSYSSPGYGTPGYGSSLNRPPVEPVDTEGPSMGLADITNARSSAEVLVEMLSAVDTNDRQVVLRDELIVELVEQCRNNQGRVMALVNTTGDEELLRQGLGLNDELQKVLARHDAIASGEPVPKEAVPVSRVTAPAQAPHLYAELEAADEDDGFGKLAHRSTARQRALAPVAPLPGPNALQSSLGDLLSGNSGATSLSLTPPVPQAQQQYPPQNAYSAPPPQNQYSAPQQQSPTPPPQQYQSPPPQQQQFHSPQPANNNNNMNSYYQQPQPLPPLPPAPARTYEQAQGAEGIKPIPGPPGEAFSQRTRQRQQLPPPPQPQQQQPSMQAPQAMQGPPQTEYIPNPFDEGGGGFGDAPTFTAQPEMQQFGFQATQFSPFGQPFQAQPPPQENTYVAPWAMAAQQPTEQQQAYMYGSNSPQQQTQPQLQPQQQQAPLAQQAPAQAQQQRTQNQSFLIQQGPQSSPNALGSSWEQSLPQLNPQQQSMLYGDSTAPAPQQPPQASAPLALPPPPAAAAQRSQFFQQQPPEQDPRRQSFPIGSAPSFNSTGSGDFGGRMGSLTLNGGPQSTGSSSGQTGQPAAAAPALAQSVPQRPPPAALTPQQLAKNVDPVDMLFGDLVDLRSAKQKNAGMSGPLLAGKMEKRMRD